MLSPFPTCPREQAQICCQPTVPQSAVLHPDGRLTPSPLMDCALTLKALARHIVGQLPNADAACTLIKWQPTTTGVHFLDEILSEFVHIV